MMGKYVIGIDGGGTKTLGAIAGADAKTLAQHEVASTNPHSNPLDTVSDRLGDLVGKLLASVGGKPDDVDCICLGMAGVDRPEDKPLIEKMIAKVLPDTKCVAVNDGVIALVAGALKPFGIIAISGTGSIAFGMNEAGERARAGGWGHILGDEGSGYVIGLRGMRAVCRAHDGRTPPTKLSDVILAHFGFDRAQQLLGWVRDIQGNKAEIGSLSRLVYEAHEQGDPIATAIINEEAADLAGQVEAVARKLFAGRGGYNIVVGGGNLRKSNTYFGIFQEKVAVLLPGIEVIRPGREPVEGAVIYALQNI
jgi:N-acetylglucosamine kinase-like BadF-type ATPase